MKEKDNSLIFRGKYFVFFVSIVYCILLLVDPSAAVTGLSRAGRIVIRIVPVFAVVIVLTACINYLLRPQQIVRHLGENSGFKGWGVALGAGIVSHGPMYAWYPLLEDMRRQGLQDRLLVAFFYARAVKLPLLPLMVDYFGMVFTCVFSVYILGCAVLQGVIFQYCGGSKRGIDEQ